MGGGVNLMISSDPHTLASLFLCDVGGYWQVVPSFLFVSICFSLLRWDEKLTKALEANPGIKAVVAVIPCKSQPTKDEKQKADEKYNVISLPFFFNNFFLSLSINQSK